MKKVKDKKRFKAVILGMEHHNALDVARQLCLSGIKPYGVINCYRFSKLKLSRYWKQCKTVKNEEEGIKVAVKYFGDEKERPVLITCTDRYAKIVDENIHYLSKYFICPGVGDQGKLSQMMNKEWQYNFAVDNDIPVVPSMVVKLSEDFPAIKNEIMEKLSEPYIIKPLVSALGDKADIRICKDISWLMEAIGEFKEKQYHSVLVQHFLDYDYEMLVAGTCFINHPYNKFILLKTHRSYPPKRGTGCFRHIILDKKLNDEIDRILKILRATGYHGLIDVELFYKNGKIYLNEFNLRSSGSSFAGNHQKFFYAADYVKDALGERIEVEAPYEIPKKISYTMTEYSDIRFPLYHNYGWKKWIKEFLKVDDYAYLHWDDPLPMILVYLWILLNIIRKKEW